MYIVVYDAYQNTSYIWDQYAINRFSINVNLNGMPSAQCRQTYYGIYGIAQLDLSFEITSDVYFSPECTIVLQGIIYIYI